jgi:hypothetical protein
MTQWYFRIRSGNFENGYYEIGSNYDLALDSVVSEFTKDCQAQGFTPISYQIVLVEQDQI